MHIMGLLQNKGQGDRVQITDAKSSFFKLFGQLPKYSAYVSTKGIKYFLKI